MPDVRPFTGLLYDPEVAGPLETLTAGPYDSITPVDQERLYRASPFNVIRLILGKDEPSDDESSNKYTRAASSLREWRRRRILVPTHAPALFPYEFQFHLGGARRTVRGLIAEVSVEPWGGSILPHERTLPGPIDDRLRLLRTVQANLSPIYAVFAQPSEALSSYLRSAMTEPPAREVVDASGTRHRLWVTSRETDAITQAVRDRPLMIADGHHRYAVALAYRKQMRARYGPGPWDSMMMLVVDGGAEDPPVLPIHRVINDRSHLVRAALNGERVRDLAEVLATLRDENLTVGTVAREEDEVVHRVATLEGHPPVVCLLHDQLLDRLRDADIRFLPDAAVAEQAVVSGAASAAFLLPPTKADRVWRVAGTGRKLPQKSTYFWPKPRTGLVIRPHTPAE